MQSEVGLHHDVCTYTNAPRDQFRVKVVIPVVDVCLRFEALPEVVDVFLFFFSNRDV